MCGCKIPQLISLPDTLLTTQAAEGSIKEDPPQLVGCPECHRLLKADFKWCPHCGAALQAHPCLYCHQEVQPGDKFCRYCGAPARL